MNKEFMENDIKALQFRDELIKLCKKYNCSMSGSNKDDGNIILEVLNRHLDFTNCYTMETYNNYSLNCDTEDYETEYIMDKYIKRQFDRESSEMGGLNNIKIAYGVITDDWGKAHLKFQELRCKYENEEIEVFSISENYMELRLINGKRYVWVRPSLCARGYRFANIIIDRNIGFEALNEVIIPICYACGRDNVEIF